MSSLTPNVTSRPARLPDPLPLSRGRVLLRLARLALAPLLALALWAGADARAESFEPPRPDTTDEADAQNGALAALRAEHARLMAEPPFRTTAHFRFFGAESVHDTLARLAEVADARFMHLCNQLDACSRAKLPIDIWVADDAESFAKVFPEPNPMSEWAAGVAFLGANRIVLRAHGTAMFSMMETFDHELAHMLHHAFVGEGRPLPRWFAEGLAVWQAGESIVQRLDEAVKAAAGDHLLEFDELARGFPNEGTKVGVAYAQSSLFVKRLVRTYGPGPVVGILHDVGAGMPFDQSFEARLGAPPAVRFEELSAALEDASNPFVFLYDGNFLWGGVTLLFLVVAWWRLRDRKRQMERLADAETTRIAEEDMALYLEREEQSGRLREPKNDPTLLN